MPCMCTSKSNSLSQSPAILVGGKNKAMYSRTFIIIQHVSIMFRSGLLAFCLNLTPQLIIFPHPPNPLIKPWMMMMMMVEEGSLTVRIASCYLKVDDIEEEEQQHQPSFQYFPLLQKMCGNFTYTFCIIYSIFSFMHERPNIYIHVTVHYFSLLIITFIQMILILCLLHTYETFIPIIVSFTYFCPTLPITVVLTCIPCPMN